MSCTCCSIPLLTSNACAEPDMTNEQAEQLLAEVVKLLRPAASKPALNYS